MPRKANPTPPPGPVTRELGLILSSAFDDAVADGRMRTQSDLAERTDGAVSQTTISRLFRGRVHVTLDAIYALCEALELDPLAVMEEAEGVVAARDRVRDSDPGRDGQRALLARAARRRDGNESLRKSS